MTYVEIVKKLRPRLERIAIKMDRGTARFDSKDLLQEALVHLWTQWKTGSLADKTDSYILQGCYFHICNYLRKNRRAAEIGAAHRHPDEMPPVPAVTYRPELNCIADDIVSRLTPRERRVLLMRAEGFTTREIGRRLGVSHVMVTKIVREIRLKAASFPGGEW